MEKKILSKLFLAFSLVLWGVNAFGGEHNYIGASKCKTCHKKAKTGNQYKKWQESAHAKAYKTLGTDEAKAAAKKAGITGDPQKSEKCLKCHVTAFGVDAKLIDSTFNMEDGVQCESCHGAGKDYKSKKTMEDKAKAIAAGLIIPDEALCKKCHNEESPTYKDFKYEEQLKTIAHPNLEKAAAK